MTCAQDLKKLLQKCKLLLLTIDRYKIWRDKGFESVHEFAAKTAGLSRWQVDDALRILRKIEDKPALRELAKKKGLNAIRPVITLTNKEMPPYTWQLRKKTDGSSPKYHIDQKVRSFRKRSNSQAPRAP